MPVLQFVDHHCCNLNGSHPIVFINKQTTLIHSDSAQVYFNAFGYLDIYACQGNQFH